MHTSFHMPSPILGKTQPTVTLFCSFSFNAAPQLFLRVPAKSLSPSSCAGGGPPPCGSPFSVRGRLGCFRSLAIRSSFTLR